jgi:hypothetical protein
VRFTKLSFGVKKSKERPLWCYISKTAIKKNIAEFSARPEQYLQNLEMHMAQRQYSFHRHMHSAEQ